MVANLSFSFDTVELQVFVAVAAAGSFSRAAERMGISQPSVSLRIKKLESKLGFKLFERSTRSVVLTPEAELFRERLVKMVRELEELVTELRGGVDERAAKVHLAATPLLSAVMIPWLIGKFNRIHPEYFVDLQDISHQDAIAGLESGAVDLAVMGLEGHYPHLEFEPLWTDRCMVIVPHNHVLANKESVSIDELAKYPILTLTLHWSGWGQLLREFKRRGILVRPSLEANSVFTLLGMVEAGLGITIVPSIVSASLDSRTLKAVSLHEIVISRAMGIVRVRDTIGSTAVRTFRSFLRRELIEISELH